MLAIAWLMSGYQKYTIDKADPERDLAPQERRTQ
jgi:hypothetical protein